MVSLAGTFYICLKPMKNLLNFKGHIFTPDVYIYIHVKCSLVLTIRHIAVLKGRGLTSPTLSNVRPMPCLHLRPKLRKLGEERKSALPKPNGRRDFGHFMRSSTGER